MRRNRTTEWLKEHPIIYDHIYDYEDPFKLLNMNELTDIQRMVKEYAKLFKYYCTFAFSASCGAGKTLAGIYLMHKFGVKTLIVSSRSAINDQWECVLKSLYPTIRIKSIHSKKVDDPQVYIYSPQYLTGNLTNFPADADFIIYDEIHSIVSDKFGECIEEPQKLVKSKKRQSMPYMLALSGTYPKASTIISKIFGNYIKTESDITKIPVNVYDYHCTMLTNLIKDIRERVDNDNDRVKVRSKKIKQVYDLTKEIQLPITNLSSLTDAQLIALDEQYDSLDDYEFIDRIIPSLADYNIHPSTAFRGFVITSTIDSSVYISIRLANHFKCNILLMRSVDEPSYIITPSEYDFNDDSRAELVQEYLPSHFKKINMQKHSLRDVLTENDIAIVCGCYHRLKEGISIENAVWGICTKFIYSTIARTQILGRIRRTSTDPAISSHVRTFIVNSSAINTNEHQLLNAARKSHSKMDRSKLKPLYDFTYEQVVFDQENYVYKQI